MRLKIAALAFAAPLPASADVTGTVSGDDQKTWWK
jgi:hypothetical protein